MKNTIKENITLIVLLLVAASSIFLFRLGWNMGEKSYAIHDKTIYTSEEVESSFEEGFNTGLNEAMEMTMASHTEIVESWMCNIQSVSINNDTIHIIDGNGEEWILLSDNYE